MYPVHVVGSTRAIILQLAAYGYTMQNIGLDFPQECGNWNTEPGLHLGFFFRVLKHIATHIPFKDMGIHA